MPQLWIGGGGESSSMVGRGTLPGEGGPLSHPGGAMMGASKNPAYVRQWALTLEAEERVPLCCLSDLLGSCSGTASWLSRYLGG